MELGKRISEIPKATTNHKNQDLEIDSHVDFLKPKSEAVAELGLTQKQAEHFQQMAKNPDAVQAAMTKAREVGDVVSTWQFNRRQSAADTMLKRRQSPRAPEQSRQMYFRF